MPINKISVADGHLADWHRFDSPVEWVRQSPTTSVTEFRSSPAVIKDRHNLLSLADPGVPSPGQVTYPGQNAWAQIKAIWEKLGGTGTPPRVAYFNREDLGKNENSAVPGQPPKPILALTAGAYAIFWMDLDFDLGGSALIELTTESTPTSGSVLTRTYATPAFPYATGGFGASPLFASEALTTGTWTVKIKYRNSFGYGPYSVASDPFSMP